MRHVFTKVFIPLRFPASVLEIKFEIRFDLNRESLSRVYIRKEAATNLKCADSTAVDAQDELIQIQQRTPD